MPLWSPEVYGRTEGLFPFELPVYNLDLTWEIRNRLEFIAYKHNFLYATLKTQDEEIDADAKFWNEHGNLNGQDELAALGTSRAFSRIKEEDFFNRNIKALEDQETVVSFFTAVEHLQSLMLKKCCQFLDPSIDAELSNWKITRKEFKKAGVVCENALNYQQIVELNKLQNKIKHLGVVDDELAGFPTFKGQSGKRIDELELSLQYYLESVHKSFL